MPEVVGQKLLVDIEEAMSLLSIGRTKLLEMTYANTLPSIKVGRRRLYPVEGLTVWARDEMVRTLQQAQ